MNCAAFFKFCDTSFYTDIQFVLETFISATSYLAGQIFEYIDWLVYHNISSYRIITLGSYRFTFLNGYSFIYIQGGSNMTGTNCDLFTHKSSRSYLNHLVHLCTYNFGSACNKYYLLTTIKSYYIVLILRCAFAWTRRSTVAPPFTTCCMH
jgi:hypothetical protein